MAIHNAHLMTVIEDQLASRAYVPAWIAVARKAPPQWQTETLAGYNFLDALKETGFVAADHQRGAPSDPVRRTFQAHEMQVPRQDFFGRIIVLPRKIDAGLVLAPLVFVIDVYNAYELAPRTLQDVINNVGAGITFVGLPTLPFVVQEQDGFQYELVISNEGPASFSGSIDHQFDTETVLVQVRGQRSIIFPFEPEAPVVERLQFLTDVLRKRDGREQRFSLRDAPRQVLDLRLSVEGSDRRLMNNILFEFQARELGVPIWFEPTLTTSPISIGQGTAQVESTSFADFRVGGLAITWDGADHFEALQIASIGATSLTFTTNYTKSFRQGVRVMPLRASFAQTGVRGTKSLRNLQETTVSMHVSETEVSLADTSAFPSFNSKVLLTDPNMAEGPLAEEMVRGLDILDGGTGRFDVLSNEEVSRRAHARRIYTRTRQRLWEVRQLLHALRGQQVSFYVPTGFDDLLPTQTILSGADFIIVENNGYSNLVAQRLPWASVLLRLKNGTSVARDVIDSSELSDDEEQIQVSSAWGVTAGVDEVDSVSFLEKVRMNGDEIEIRHISALGQAVVTIPVIGVRD